MTNIEATLDRLRTASSLSIVCHTDPDPDCLASAIALELLARETGVDVVDILYGGTISHQQNRAFVNVFDIELTEYSDTHVETAELIAFVDHSLPGNHNPVPEGTDIDIVIDHHPTDEPIPADIVDVRETYGAAATILTEYIRDSPVEMTTRVASGLLFGIHRERLDFIRQPTIHEYNAAKYLDPQADIKLLRELYGASFTSETVDTVGAAINNRVQRESCLLSWVGRAAGHDALTQAADYLLNIQGSDTVLVYGIVDDEVQLSARSNRGDLDLGARLKQAFGDIGRAGGHADMAGGQIPVHQFRRVTDHKEALHNLIEKWVRHRFVDVMGISEDVR